jgi:hypothetical protein
MNTSLILALLAVAATMATANAQISPFFQEQQQPFFWQQPFFQPLQQQLNPCRQFLFQQCIPVVAVPFLQSQILQQSSCQVMRQQCCQQLAQIPEQLRCPAIHSVVQAIIFQQQLQQQQFFQPQQLGFFQPWAQQLGQSFFQPQQQAQLEGLRAFALQALPAMCDVYVPPHCSIATAPLGAF